MRAVGVLDRGVVGIEPVEEFEEIRDAVAVSIERGIERVVRIEAVGEFPGVQHSVLIVIQPSDAGRWRLAGGLASEAVVDAVLQRRRASRSGVEEGEHVQRVRCVGGHLGGGDRPRARARSPALDGEYTVGRGDAERPAHFDDSRIFPGLTLLDRSEPGRRGGGNPADEILLKVG